MIFGSWGDSFSTEFFFNDPTAKAMIEKSGMPPEKVREIAGSVVSIKVSAVNRENKNMKEDTRIEVFAGGDEEEILRLLSQVKLPIEDLTMRN